MNARGFFTVSPKPSRSLSAIALGGLVALAGCLTTPPSPMLELSRLSPLKADPGAIRLAARLPDPLQVRDGDIRLRISFDGGTDATRLVEEYAAIIVDAPAGTPGIAPGSAGERTYVAALSGEDAESLRAVQRRIRDWRAGGMEGEGQLAVSATACAAGPLPDGPIRLTTWMRTEPDAPFFVLTRGVDLRRQIERRGAPADAIERCASG